MNLDMAVGFFGGLVTGLLLSLLVWLFFKPQPKALGSAELQSMRVRHIQSRHWH